MGGTLFGDSGREEQLAGRTLAVSPVAVLWAEENGQIAYANDAAVRLLGYDREAFSRMRLSDFALNDFNRPTGSASGTALPARDQDSGAERRGGLYPNFMFELVRRDGPLRLESDLRKRDGESLPVEIFLSIAPFEGREYLCCLVADISARRDFEKRRSEHDERYRSLIELSPDGIVIHTRGNIVYLNPSAVRLIGARSADQLLGRSVMEFIPPDLREFVRERIDRLVDEGDQASLAEEIFMRLDGTPLPVEVTATRIPFNNESSVMVLFRDITPRLKTESLLLRSEALLAEAQSMAHIGSWEWVFGEDRWTWTEETYRLYEITRDTALSLRTILRRVPQDERRALTKMFINAAREARPSFAYEHSLILTDGQTRFLQGLARIDRNAEGFPWRMAGTIQDVTERRTVENEVRRLNDQLEARVRLRTAELEFANRELESFSYSVSHDLRAPLRAIDGFSQALVEDQAHKLDQEGLDYLKRIRAGCERMGQLIDSILDLSRLTRSELRVRPVDLSRLVGEITDEMRVASGNPDRLEFRIQADVVTSCDERLMRVVLENLMENAVKYTGRKEHALIEFGAEETPGGSVFFVRDNGVGFDMMHAGRLFGVFQRMHAPQDFPGNGIGLATVQRIIHRHRGTIRAVALPDEGATFYFTLGVSAEDEESQ